MYTADRKCGLMRNMSKSWFCVLLHKDNSQSVELVHGYMFTTNVWTNQKQLHEYMYSQSEI